MALNIPTPDFGNAKSLEDKFNILADSYNMLRKELDYVLQNLSFDNFDKVSAKNLYGMSIHGGELNINDAYIVDKEGNVQMLGNIILGGNISFLVPPVLYQYSVDNISWHSLMTSEDKYRRESWDGGETWGEGYQFVGADGIDGINGADGSDANVPTYIKSTYIDMTKIISPDIVGGMFYATGQGRNSGAAYYIYNGVSGTGGNTSPVNLKGYISYDDNGAGTAAEDVQRVFFKTSTGVAMKIESGGNMSLEAKGGTIHIMSNVAFYGTTTGITAVAKFA